MKASRFALPISNLIAVLFVSLAFTSLISAYISFDDYKALGLGLCMLVGVFSSPFLSFHAFGFIFGFGIAFRSKSKSNSFIVVVATSFGSQVGVYSDERRSNEAPK